MIISPLSEKLRSNVCGMLEKWDHLIYFIGEFRMKLIFDFLLSFCTVFFLIPVLCFLMAQTDTKMIYISYCCGWFPPPTHTHLAVRRFKPGFAPAQVKSKRSSFFPRHIDFWGSSLCQHLMFTHGRGHRWASSHLQTPRKTHWWR